MKLPVAKRFYERSRSNQRGSVFVIVLLICCGLVSICLYFANSMSLELRAADNRTSGLASDQIIEGATRYLSSIIATYATNGAMPDPSLYSAEAVPVGNSKNPDENGRFWLIGRDPNNGSGSTTPSSTTDPVFGLVDEASKLDLNAPWVTADVLSTNLSLMTIDLANGIADWRDTNSTASGLNYGQYGYQAKHAPFESVGELRLVYGATADILAGEDINRNGVLDANEHDDNGNGYADPGVMEYFTVYSRQPNAHSDGTALTNVNDRAGMQTLLGDRLGSSRATQIIGRAYGGGTGGGPPGGNFGNGGGPTTFASVLAFYMQSGMNSDEFGMIYNDVTATNAAFTTGRVNINTAPPAVLACLPGMDANSLQQIISYRQSNPTLLTSVAWLVDALGSGSTVLTTLARGDYITTQSYQFSADIAAVGPFGRGYRRVRVVFDISEGTPKIIYRQDLSRLGWALGKQTRDTWIVKNTR
jgi:type II secretory pathway component PulK